MYGLLTHMTAMNTWEQTRKKKAKRDKRKLIVRHPEQLNSLGNCYTSSLHAAISPDPFFFLFLQTEHVRHLKLEDVALSDSQAVDKIFGDCKRLVSFEAHSCEASSAAWSGLKGHVNPFLESFFLYHDPDSGWIPCDDPSVLLLLAAAFPNLRSLTLCNMIHLKHCSSPRLPPKTARAFAAGCPLLCRLSICWEMSAETMRGTH